MKKAALILTIIAIFTTFILSGFAVEEVDRLTQEEFYRQVEALGIKREKPASEYTEGDIDKIVKLLPRRFADLTGSEWYIRDLAIMTAKGIVNGYGKDGKIFAGNQIVTRAEYWAMQGRLEGLLDNKENFQKYGYYTDPMGFRIVEDMVTYSKRFKDMHKEWWFPYYFNQIAIPFGTYGVEEMRQPVYRGEVAVLTGAKMWNKEGWDIETIRVFAKTRYFKDVPLNFLTSEQTHNDHELIAKLINEIDSSTPYYYPPFQKVVIGQHKLTEYVVKNINFLNYQGIMCGMPDGTSGWNKELTRAEAMAVLARAFRPQQRLAVEKRMKDTSELGFHPTQQKNESPTETKPNNTSEKVVPTEVPKQSSGTEVTDRTNPVYNENFTFEEKIEWFENSLGFIREKITYEEEIAKHFDLLGIPEGEFKVRHEQWVKFIQETKKFEFSPEGLFKYMMYLETSGIK